MLANEALNELTVFGDEDMQELNKISEDIGGVKADIKNLMNLLKAADERSERSRSRVHSKLESMDKRVSNIEKDMQEFNDIKPFLTRLRRGGWVMVGVAIAFLVAVGELTEPLAKALKKMISII